MERKTDYDHLSSAYVQHLAEICFTILYDDRWNNNLFGWEHGDDLSVVTSFSKKYDPKANFKNKTEVEKLKSGNICDCENGCLEQVYLEPESSVTPVENNLNPQDLDDIRILHLYSRIFVRKGPWFRLNDLFSRYYSITFLELNEKTKIFGPSCAYRFFLKDIARLIEMGFIRSFSDDDECGNVAGYTRLKGGILTIQERVEFSKKISQNGRDAFSKRIHPTKNEKINEVLGSSKSQHTVITSYFSTTSIRKDIKSTKKCTKHCANIGFSLKDELDLFLLKRFINKQSNCCSEAMRNVHSWIEEISNVWQSLCCASTRDLMSPLPPCCIRLREAPLRTLRRVVRLYLIATDGPGNMREGAWISLAENVGWSKLRYPGLLHRMKIQQFNFLSHYQALSCPCISNHGLFNNQEYSCDKYTRNKVSVPKETMVLVFSKGKKEFEKWEECVEIRAQIDYLLPLNELTQWKIRNEGKHAKSSGISSQKIGIVSSDVIDRMDILLRRGRFRIFILLLDSVNCAHERAKMQMFEATEKLIEKIVSDVHTSSLFNTHAEEEHTQSHTIIIIFIVMAACILQIRFKALTSKEINDLIDRPWMRHMTWEAILANIIWDGIPLFEKCSQYEVSLFLLETIIFGNIGYHENMKQREKCNCFVCSDFSSTLFLDFHYALINGFFCSGKMDNSPYVQLLLSRRTRGKAIERFVIDVAHLHRKKEKSGNVLEECKENHRVQMNVPSSASSKKCKRENIEKIVSFFIEEEGSRASIPFSSLRNISKKLKRPLIRSFENIWNCEMIELQLRLKNDSSFDNSSSDVNQKSAKKRKASKTMNCGWCPRIDNSIAHSMSTDVGGRCSYVGWEDENKKSISTRSLNVEELALEEYYAGNLPQIDEKSDSVIKGGGWRGWHDEGGHVRALFRILCSRDILGFKNEERSHFIAEDFTVFLTPYQAAPHDLHVGHSYICMKNHTHVSESKRKPVRSFYERRRAVIEEYCTKMNVLRNEDICDNVFKEVTARLNMIHGKHYQDTFLDRDIKELRTLSMIGAGLGGNMLAAIFRCLCFDYRHFSGGLPDLLLIRATSADIQRVSGECVSLSDWIGEGFSAEGIHVGKSSDLSKLFFDRADEFLGCEKSSDFTTFKKQKREKAKEVDMDQGNQQHDLGKYDVEKLSLTFNGSAVNVDCMFIEVKSLNDRLDARQEDWLNILDKHGHARVCKFNNRTK